MKKKVDGWVIAIVLVVIAVPLWPLIGFGLSLLFDPSPNPLGPEPEPGLSELARRVKTLDHASAVALAEEHLARHGRPQVECGALTVDAEGRVFTLVGDGGTSEYQVCLIRGPQGWLAWQSSGRCATDAEFVTPVQPQAVREKLLQAMLDLIHHRRAALELPDSCAGVARVPLAEVGYLDKRMQHLESWVARVVLVDITSPVVNTCPANANPWKIAMGNCGLDAPWKYVVVFDLFGSGEARPQMRGGPMSGTVELLDMSTGTALCRRSIDFASSEEPLKSAAWAAQESYRTRAYAYLCAEVAALGKGALPTPKHWACR